MNSTGRMLPQIQHTNKTTYTYNTMIKTHLSNSNTNPQMALELYVKMKRNGINCDNYTYPFVLKACKMICGLWEGRQVHGEVMKAGFFDSDVFVRNGLIGMYFKCQQMSCSRILFDGFHGKDLVSWNLMLGGYAECRNMVEAQKLFDEMPERDVVSWSIMIDGYGKKLGLVTHARMLFDQMHERDSVSWNTMINSYAKIGNMVAARELFNLMDHKTLISWTIMINGYSQHQNPKEALTLFNLMLSHNVKPDKFCVIGSISACAQLGALDSGRWLHTYIKKTKIPLDIVVNTALIDMYMKCGGIEEARAVFNSMLERNVITYNVMISGLGINNSGAEALSYFYQMEQDGMELDDLVYVSVLSACSHAGFVSEGVEIFKRIRNPKVEHYGCLIDLLVRKGEFGKALNFIGSMPMEPNVDLWGSVLLGCRVWKNVRLGEFVVDRLKEIGGDDRGVYVLMSNIYADSGMWDGVAAMRRIVAVKGVVEGGKSVIEVVGGGVEEFVSGKIGGVRGAVIEEVVCSLSKMVDLE
ncbi:hypothetical protein Lser_V15G16973 [Lactuca serriola]